MNNIENSEKKTSTNNKGTGALSSIIFMIVTVIIMIVLSNFIG